VIAATGQRREFGDASARFTRQGPACQIHLMAARSRIVGGKTPRRSIAVMEFAEIGNARENVVACAERIAVKTATRAQLLPVAGMICISPMAPACDMARLSALSTCMTLHILCAGMFNRGAASAMNAALRSVQDGRSSARLGSATWIASAQDKNSMSAKHRSDRLAWCRPINGKLAAAIGSVKGKVGTPILDRP
jgi:hypothetical protein